MATMWIDWRRSSLSWHHGREVVPCPPGPCPPVAQLKGGTPLRYERYDLPLLMTYILGQKPLYNVGPQWSERRIVVRDPIRSGFRHVVSCHVGTNTHGRYLGLSTPFSLSVQGCFTA